MPVWEAVIYGVVQGLAEFLPISSSGHLALLPWLFGWEDPGLAFDVALHWGTLAAVLLIFWRDWIRMISAGLFGRGTPTDRRLFWGLVISAFPAALIGKLLDKWAEENLRSPLLIAGTMATLGIILWLADRVGRKSRTLAEMTLPRAFSIGVAQAAALVPGVSRSGATISAGLFQDFTREEIARFSFLMSTPIIFGAGLLKLPKMVHDMRAGDGAVTPVALAAGFLAAAIVGAAVIRWMLGFLRQHTYAVFAWYRLAVAALVVVLWLSGKR
jgi:undecaprenyl-diphosphatase